MENEKKRKEKTKNLLRILNYMTKNHFQGIVKLYAHTLTIHTKVYVSKNKIENEILEYILATGNLHNSWKFHDKLLFFIDFLLLLLLWL